MKVEFEQLKNPGLEKRRGRYIRLLEVPNEYPVFTVRLLRRLVLRARIAFSKVGKAIVFSVSHIEDYLEFNRVPVIGNRAS